MQFGGVRGLCAVLELQQLHQQVVVHEDARQPRGVLGAERVFIHAEVLQEAQH